MLLQQKCIQSTFAALNAAIKLLWVEVGMFHGWIKFSSKQIESGISNKPSLFHCIDGKKRDFLPVLQQTFDRLIKAFLLFSAPFSSTRAQVQLLKCFFLFTPWSVSDVFAWRTYLMSQSDTRSVLRITPSHITQQWGIFSTGCCTSLPRICTWTWAARHCPPPTPLCV